jgi:hypothetical protein
METHAPIPAPTPPRTLRVGIIFRQGLEPDQELAFVLEQALVERGNQVFVDRRKLNGLNWARALEEQLRGADAVIVLVSAASAASEMLACEVELAEAAEAEQNGWPRLIPVRLNLQGSLPAPLDALLRRHEFEWDEDLDRHRSRQLHWQSPSDDAALFAEIQRRLAAAARDRDAETLETPSFAPGRPHPPLEPVGGAVPLDSQFYILRPSDDEFHTAVQRRDSLVLIKGARQMGKTSLLARGLHAARTAGDRVILTDLQKLASDDFRSLRSFLSALSNSVAHQLQLDLAWQRRWENQRAPNVNFEDFWRRDVLGRLPEPIVWAVDEFDRLLVAPFATEFCGLLRSWHNERALNPGGPWRSLTIAIAYATEAHLFITDINQSPFNVGTRLSLRDFTYDEVAELNRRYAEPLRGSEEVAQFFDLVGGQPYLVRRGLHELAERRVRLDGLSDDATQDDGVFGEHLRRLLVALNRDPLLTAAARSLLTHGEGPRPDLFYRLRTAGVIRGDSASTALFRCRLYERFLRRHLA